MSAKPGTTVIRNDKKKIIDAVRRLAKMQVLVGVPSDKAERDDDAPINNAALAYLNTFGGTIQMPERTTTVFRKMNKDGSFADGGQFTKASKANFASDHVVPAHEVEIPARPFLEPGIENSRPQTMPKLKAAAQAALTGDFTGAMQKLNEAGLLAQNAVRAVINAGILPKLAPSTLRARRARGRTGTNPLEDTGELRNSITYVVRQK